MEPNRIIIAHHIPRLVILFFGIILITVSSNAQNNTVSADTSQIKSIEQSIKHARYYEDKGDSVTALKHHKLALQKSKKFGSQEHQAKSLVNIAKLLKNNDATQSLRHLQHALAIANRLNSHKLRADIFLAMSGIYKQQQNYEEALSTLESHQKLLERIFEKNKQREIARLKADEKARLEKYIYLTTIIFAIIIAGVLLFYFIKTSRLNKALRTSNHIKDKLFSIIGHDLRGPSGSIMEALNMIGSGILSEQEEKETITLLKGQSQSFNETLNSLFSWASTQLQGTKTVPSNIDLTSIIRRAINVLESQSRIKNLQVTCEMPTHLPVVADPDQIEFVIRNLLSNAIKFSYENGSIEIMAKQDGKQAVISITDHGTGMTKEKQQQFLESGSYIESSYGTKAEKGTGLGLMLSKEFAEANKGNIWLESNDQGTAFYFSLQSQSDIKSISE